MRIDLTGKTALVTGSSSGIGLAIAQGLAAAGANVILHGRDEGKLEKVRTQLAAAHPLAQFPVVASDLGTAAGAEAVIKAHPEVDILINNAGIFEPREFADIDDARWETMLDVNVMSGVRLSRHYLPRMLKANWGRIVFISSESALNIPAEMIHYGVSKTAQLALSRGLAQLTAGSAVTVNAVLPGPTRSDGVGDFFGKIAQEQGISQEQVEQDFIKTHRPTSLIKRLAKVEEVANMVVYVSSPQASATNGAALRVDGGVVNFIA
ncbi:NAD(P)-dependent dehydrogenase (short-subunit alcohol dehydrogenase family) [Silvimonas terrae]|uniref:NAD(P)-dependent dehydrogenase (Short-subunit alcohol dehydrogenase family) n=1 Tax=Silvimonas terrae TaxID=300266 RepID=A0A840RKV5_9NEIS|nr:SDR family oxidoreductase [Silvimonas terrae]MBB5193214.1 NAD(P)-dependent dehydrogenase (short-subunit alcohol dehydrogenase family) [Silvimonas terrae]